MPLRSFVLDAEALAKLPELLKPAKQAIRAEQLRRGDVSAVDEKSIAVVVHYVSGEQPARKESWGRSENVPILPKGDDRNPNGC